MRDFVPHKLEGNAGFFNIAGNAAEQHMCLASHYRSGKVDMARFLQKMAHRAASKRKSGRDVLSQ
jgi:hypothetical protein